MSRNNGHDPSPKRPARAAHESHLYGQFSALYDAVVGRFFLPRIIGVIRALEIPADARVLELGVGTGGSLAAYPPTCHVQGIDRSTDMLRQAREKIERAGWKHIEVDEGDATDLAFADDSFDYVMAFHVVTVVPDPLDLMREAIRVCRPDGYIVVINRFRSPKGLMDELERRTEPLTRHWGWRTLRRRDVFDSLPLEIVDARHGGPIGLFTSILAQNRKGRSVAAGRR